MPKRGKGRRNMPLQRPEEPGPPLVSSSQKEEDAPHQLVREQEPIPNVAHAESRRQQQKEKPRPMHPEELGIQVEQQLTLQPQKPPRPGFGKLGTKINLVANCYPIEIPSGFVYHYDVEIVSKRQTLQSTAMVDSSSGKKYRCMGTKRNRQVINAMVAAYNQHFKDYYPAFDGRKNLYTRRPLKNTPLKLDVMLEDEDRPQSLNAGDQPDRCDTFHVTVKPVHKKETKSCAISLDPVHALFRGQISTVPQEAVMALETVLRNGPCFKHIPVGRSFFFPPAPDARNLLGGGREVWFGYHQSLRLGQWQPMVNIDITATPFYQKGPIIDYICNILNCNKDALDKTLKLKDYDIVRLSKELKNLRVEVNHLKYKRKYRILKLTRESANKLEFPITIDGITESQKVSEYFFRQHKKRLAYPHLPCLQVGPLNKKVYLPLEVCDLVEGQHCRKKLSDQQTAEMIKFTARAPKERFGEIRGIREDADFDHDAYVREFGLKVSRQPMRLEGRVIEAPNVRYNQEIRVRPKEGSWDMRNKQFYQGADVNNWVLISFAYINMQSLENFARMLSRIGKESGIKIGSAATVEVIDTRRRYQVDEILEKFKRNYKADLAVVVLPQTNKTIYGEIKQAAETVLGLTTQCVKEKNVQKCSPSLVSNLCQKINAKKGGVNNSLTPGETPGVFRKPIIIIGADVTHPAPTDKIKPSLAAAVGSLDSHPSRYAVTCRAQTNTDENKQAIEIILDLKSMVVDLLKAFYRSTKGLKPEKIILYRDGVSEGQFETVRAHEVKAVRDACRSLSIDYEPGITFIVVQKRHHIRFIPQDLREGVGRMRNIPPGTTVDTQVSHPVDFDFFLCSHFGLQGTSRPSRYIVLEDDNSFTADDLQKLTYFLCHTYVRCTKSISVPSPVQYAHLAAFRARQHLVSQMDDSSASSDISSAPIALPQNLIDAIKVVDDLKNTMYFV